MKRAIVIDDDTDVREVLSMYLEMMGFSVDTLRGGRLGIEKIKECEYDYIFCDLKMPDMKGDEVLRELERVDKGLIRRFILVTGAMIDEKTEGFFHSKGVRILKKPFTLNDIESILH